MVCGNSGISKLLAAWCIRSQCRRGHGSPATVSPLGTGHFRVLTGEGSDPLVHRTPRVLPLSELCF